MPDNNKNEYPHVSEQTPGILTQKHIRSDYALIKIGTAANRPTSGNAQVILYFATDTFVMSYWTGTAWVSGSAFS